MDDALAAASDQVARYLGNNTPVVETFFDEVSCTATHLIVDPVSKAAAIVDSVLDYDASTRRISTASADLIVAMVRERGLTVDWIFETHVHADHLSAAGYLRRQVGGLVAASEKTIDLRRTFGRTDVCNVVGTDVDLSFDHLMQDGAQFRLGTVQVTVLDVPGHTPTDMALVIGDAIFAGDTLFMPDSGTARADFPGGSAQTLYHSIRRLLSLPKQARMFLCHDYKAQGRANTAWETNIRSQCENNIHVRDEISENSFIAIREERDATLSPPQLMSVAIPFNLGHA